MDGYAPPDADSPSAEAPTRGLYSATLERSCESLKARAYEQLVLDIILGDYPADGRLDERVLARKYGVGVAGVRDALGRLALEGLVWRQPRYGTLVAPPNLSVIQQAHEARTLVEPHMAALAAQHAAPAQIQQLRASLADGTRAMRGGDYRRVVEIGRQFYDILSKAAGNLYLTRAVASLYQVSARLWVQALPQTSPEDLLQGVALYGELVEAIEARDPARARAAMEAIVGALPENVLRSVSASRTPPAW